MSYQLALLSVIVAGGYWGSFYLRNRAAGGPAGVLHGALLLAAVALCGLGLLGRELEISALAAAGAVGVGGGACLLVVGPALRAIARRAAAAERYGLAGRLLDAADVLAPGAGVGEEKALLGAMREIRDGRIEPTVDALTRAKTGAPPEAHLAIDERIVMLYLAADRWAEGCAHAEAHLWPALPAPGAAPEPASVATPVALRRALGLAPPVWVELVGAYGRTGELERAAGLLARLEDACAGRADAAVWLHRARLMFLALAGRVAATDALTSGAAGRHLAPAARLYWRAVAHERHGDTAAAAAAYARARGKSRGKSRVLVDQALARLPATTAAALGPIATAVIARVEGAPPPAVTVRRARGPVATWGLTAAIVGVAAIVAIFVGPSGDPGVLLRVGAMSRTQIDAGEWWRLMSAVFVHVGLEHVVLNAISLWMIGRICEQLLGTARTLAVFLLAGVAGFAASYLASESAMSAGASGGVMGLLGAVFAELSLHRSRYRALWRRGVWGGIAIVTIAEVGFGFLFPVVDQWAHVAGLATGAVVIALLSPHARWGGAATHVARGLAAAGALLALIAGVQVLRTSLADSLTAPPLAAWHVGGVTFDAPAVWATHDGELVDDDIFLVLAVTQYDQSRGLDADLAAWVASEPERATKRNFDAVAPATERAVPLPPGWQGSEYVVSYEDPMGDRTAYRVIVAGRELGGKVVLASLYAPDSIARAEPEILSGLLASAR